MKVLLKFNAGQVVRTLETKLSDLRMFLTLTLDLLTTTECVVCGAPSFGSSVCGECAMVVRAAPAPLTQKIRKHEIHYFGLYDGKLRDLILAYKFRNHPSISKYLAQAVVSVVAAHEIRFDYVSYVPATRTARMKRGFDHMQLVAKRVGRVTGKTVVQLLTTKRETEQLASSDRREAVRGKFAAVGAVNHSLDGKTVLFLDDVITTGSTLEECLSVLGKNFPKTNFLPVVVALTP